MDTQAKEATENKTSLLCIYFLRFTFNLLVFGHLLTLPWRKDERVSEKWREGILITHKYWSFSLARASEYERQSYKNECRLKFHKNVFSYSPNFETLKLCSTLHGWTIYSSFFLPPLCPHSAPGPIQVINSLRGQPTKIFLTAKSTTTTVATTPVVGTSVAAWLQSCMKWNDCCTPSIAKT